jgi:Protein of unknown function (DUF1761)
LFEADVNYLAVILAALAAQPLGFLWYGSLFGSTWVAARGYSHPGEGETPSSMIYIVPLIGALVIAYVLARLADMTGADDVGDCIALGAFVWVGFSATVLGMQINFSETPNKPVAFAIEGGYYLVSFVIAGAIIGAFQ